MQGGPWEPRQNWGNFTLSIQLQYKGLMREMSYERQARVLVVPVAPRLQIEIK